MKKFIALGLFAIGTVTVVHAEVSTIYTILSNENVQSDDAVLGCIKIVKRYDKFGNYDYTYSTSC